MEDGGTSDSWSAARVNEDSEVKGKLNHRKLRESVSVMLWSGLRMENLKRQSCLQYENGKEERGKTWKCD